jgi:hypothetical protein
MRRKAQKCSTLFREAPQHYATNINAVSDVSLVSLLRGSCVEGAHRPAHTGSGSSTAFSFSLFLILKRNKEKQVGSACGAVISRVPLTGTERAKAEHRERAVAPRHSLTDACNPRRHAMSQITGNGHQRRLLGDGDHRTTAAKDGDLYIGGSLLGPPGIRVAPARSPILAGIYS